MERTADTSNRRATLATVALPVLLLLLASLGAWAYPQLLEQRGPGGPAAAAAAGASTAYATPLTYILIAAVFLPLVLRRKYPLIVLGVATVLSAAYSLTPNPPTMTELAPVIALYMVGTVRDRRTTVIAFAAATLFTLAVTVPVSGLTWVGDVISVTAVFAVAASLGDATRSRRAYIAAIEQRALDAERTREDEARRRVGEERLRIARELHDVTAHSLSIIALQAGAAEKAVRRDPEGAINALHTIRMTSKNSLDELRAMLGVLRSADEDAPLSPAGRLETLPELVRTVEQAGVHVTLDVADDLGDIPAYVDVSAYRIVQEAITNIVRHAKASTARVTVRREADELVLEIADDGRGALPGEMNEGHGISGMRERVAALSGTFEAGPVAGGGFRVAARLPLVGKGAQRREG